VRGLVVRGGTGGGDGGDAPLINSVNAVLGHLPLRLYMKPDGALGLSGKAGGLPGALAALVAEVAYANATGRWSRLRICAAPDFGPAFYDASRN
jgi:hypothetical protein